MTKNADNTTYTLAVANCVKTIAKGEFSANNSVTTRLARTVALNNTRLNGKLGASPDKAITKIILPQTLTKIGDYAFYNHRKVEGMFTIGKGVQSIGDAAFQHLGRELASAHIDVVFAPNSALKTIGTDAFARARLKKLALPKQLETIKARAFDTVNLKENSSLLIPAKVGAIEGSAFFRVNFSGSGTLTIESPSVTLGSNAFAVNTSNRYFAIVKLPQALYGRYNTAQRANIFGNVGAYQKLDGSPQ